TYSFVSISEISEYVPSVEQYSARLVREGDEAGSPAHQAKVRAYEQRLPIMNQQRLTPDVPNWPAMCFYPMNKMRNVGANWFTLPYDERKDLMYEHGASGRTFAGRVVQVVTGSAGLDDFEWGVTLFANHPDDLKEVVYTMRFDEASALYGEFGAFYTGYVTSADDLGAVLSIG
ncbi:MAG: chlorite dismutase family protein, partial [Acidimicrobiales bacterium]|nr:chlorite dismutase family protein [Acidimicrobiales bacterium]